MSRHKHHKHRHGSILALDRNYVPMSEISRRHGLKAIFSGRAWAINLKTYEMYPLDEVAGKPFHAIMYPAITAIKEVRLLVGKGTKGILRRDNHTCQYCGGHATTVDHVVPRCQGGETSWKNCVGCCWKCNQRKGGRTPEQAGMTLLRKPMSPRAHLFDKFYKLAEIDPYEKREAHA